MVAKRAKASKALAAPAPTPAPAGAEAARSPAAPGGIGWTPDGAQFSLPRTRSTAYTLSHPFSNASNFITMGLVSAQIVLLLTGAASRETHVAMFFFWRVLYNVGLGLLLHFQSHKQTVTRIYQCLARKPNSVQSRIVHYLAYCNLPTPTGSPNMMKQYPPSFTAWLMFRELVNFVLINDAFNVAILAIRCVDIPEVLTWPIVLQYLAGVILVGTTYWAKTDAHRCIGDYCWYWGDFFFRKAQELTFDGIFELFPHPMYTVGYSSYYAVALLSRSYIVLFSAMSAHAMQILFLFLVEEPHIQRLYGTQEASKAWDRIEIVEKHLRKVRSDVKSKTNELEARLRVKTSQVEEKIRNKTTAVEEKLRSKRSEVEAKLRSKKDALEHKRNQIEESFSSKKLKLETRLLNIKLECARRARILQRHSDRLTHFLQDSPLDLARAG